MFVVVCNRINLCILGDLYTGFTFSMKKTVTLIILHLFVNGFCYGQDYVYFKPKNFGDGWRTSDLKSQSVDTALIYKLFTQLKGRKNEIHSVLVIKNNHILIEEYFNGQVYNQKHDLRSATKSITSILMGIAIDKGFVENVNDPISKYLKNFSSTKNLGERKNKITIKHVLTMSTGLDCNDWDKKSLGQEDKIYKKNNWLQYFLNLPMVNEPGAISNYCTMGQVLASEIISLTSGMTIDKFAEKYLFKPLNINHVTWGHTSKKEVISSGKRLYMTSRDMARIGQLILNNGKWNDKQVVSSKWIEESTTPKTTITGVDYGYLWWNVPFQVNDRIIFSKMATGNGGQYIMVFPDLDIVLVFTGGAYNSQEDKLPFAITKDVFLPTFASGK